MVKQSPQTQQQDLIDLIVGDLENKHGKGSATTLNSNTILCNVDDWVSTDSRPIDLLIQGGLPEPQPVIPFGRLTEIAGLEHTGKCLVGGTYLSTERGLETIEELFIAEGVAPSCSSKTTKKQVGVMNRFGDLESSTHFTNNNRQPVTEVSTQSGYKVQSTSNHPHMVMSERGMWVWRKTKDLREGDFLVCQRRTIDPPKGGYIPEDEAYFLGVCLADAHFGEARISITNDDSYVVEFLRKKAPGILGVTPCEYPAGDSVDFQFNSKEQIGRFYEKHGLSPGLAKDKVFPRQLRTLCRKSLICVIQGYLDCECSIDPDKSGLEVASASYELLFQLKLLLAQYFGVVSTLHEKQVSSYPDNDYWRLSIHGDALRRYAEEVGFRTSQRKESVAKISVSGKTHVDTIPLIGGMLEDLFDTTETTREHGALVNAYIRGRGHSPSYEQLRRILTEVEWGLEPLIKLRLWEIIEMGYFYDSIVSIDSLERKPTFDISMESTHSFVANGVVTHNTSLCGQIMKRTQMRGGICCLADTENAIDVKYMEKLGVDLSKVIMVQPEHMEDVFDKFESLILTIRQHAKNNLISVIWDSVGATPTKAEIEGKAGDKHVGLAARVIGQNLRRLVAPVTKTKTALIFTNHLYQDIKVTYGDPWKTYGGGKIRYLATLRLRLTVANAIKTGSGDSEKVIGQYVRVKTIKNKMAPGLMEVKVPLLHNFGFCDDYVVYERIKTKKVASSILFPSGAEGKFRGWDEFIRKITTHTEYPELLKIIQEQLAHEALSV